MELLTFVFLTGLTCTTVSASLHCGSYECHGHAPYCCMLDSGDVGCCWESYVYNVWWFWAIWVIMFFLVMACSVTCWRRRNQRLRYVVMARSEYPTYGTVIHSHTSTQQQGGVVVAGPPPPQYGAPPPGFPQSHYGGVPAVPGATQPLVPPSYVNKPPPYSG